MAGLYRVVGLFTREDGTEAAEMYVGLADSPNKAAELAKEAAVKHHGIRGVWAADQICVLFNEVDFGDGFYYTDPQARLSNEELQALLAFRTQAVNGAASIPAVEQALEAWAKNLLKRFNLPDAETVQESDPFSVFPGAQQDRTSDEATPASPAPDESAQSLSESSSRPSPEAATAESDEPRLPEQSASEPNTDSSLT